MEKKEYPNVNIPITTLKRCIPTLIQQLFVLANWVPVRSVNDITEEHLKSCGKGSAIVAPANYDLALLENEI